MKVNSPVCGCQSTKKRSSPDNRVRHDPSHNTQHMSSATRLPRHKNVLVLKTFNCFIPARWTNQKAAGGASRSTGQVTRKAAGRKGSVGTPAGHHPPPSPPTRSAEWKCTVASRAGGVVRMGETRNTCRIFGGEIWETSTWKTEKQMGRNTKWMTRERAEDSVRWPAVVLVALSLWVLLPEWVI